MCAGEIAGERLSASAVGSLMVAVTPHEWEVHQAPHDYFRYTRYRAAYLFCLEQAGFAEDRDTSGGRIFPFAFTQCRMLNGLQFIHRGRALDRFSSRRIACWGRRRLALPFLDFLDRERNFTLGYICIAEKG